MSKLINGRCCLCNLAGRHFLHDLVEEEVGVELRFGEVVAAARAVALVAEVRDDAHVAEAVAAGGEEGVLDDAHADRAQQVPVCTSAPGTDESPMGERRRRCVGMCVRGRESRAAAAPGGGGGRNWVRRLCGRRS